MKVQDQIVFFWSGDETIYTVKFDIQDFTDRRMHLKFNFKVETQEEFDQCNMQNATKMSTQSVDTLVCVCVCQLLRRLFKDNARSMFGYTVTKSQRGKTVKLEASSFSLTSRLC